MPAAVPATEGIKYAGSKLSLLPHILSLVDDLEGIHKVFDAFSGSTRVSQAFAQRGWDTTANDISVTSETLARCYLLSKRSDAYYQKIIDELNALPGTEGWFSEYYGGDPRYGNPIKYPFQRKNTLRLDAIRQHIARLSLSKTDESVLLTSLLLALDAVDNTMGHQVSYLAKWSRRSFDNLHLRLPKRFFPSTRNRVLRKDVMAALQGGPYDLAYLDPPYGSNNPLMPTSRVRYASYYHLWTSVVLNDQPVLFGKAFRREDSRDAVSASIFEEYRKNDQGCYLAAQALEEVVCKVPARYVLLSYSSKGRIAEKDIEALLGRHGQLLVHQKIVFQQNVMAQMRSTSQWVNSDEPYYEHLFLLDKNC